jgi:hypothetical protein
LTPTEILAALARHGTRVVVDGERVRLIHDLGNAPPVELVNAAREAKPALRHLLDRSALPKELTARWTQLVLRWGGSINEGVAVVQRVCAAAGPAGCWRRGLVGHLFARLGDGGTAAGRSSTWS